VGEGWRGEIEDRRQGEGGEVPLMGLLMSVVGFWLIKIGRSLI